MKNLNKFGVQELGRQEMVDIDGGNPLARKLFEEGVKWITGSVAWDVAS